MRKNGIGDGHDGSDGKNVYLCVLTTARATGRHTFKAAGRATAARQAASGGTEAYLQVLRQRPYYQRITAGKRSSYAQNGTIRPDKMPQNAAKPPVKGGLRGVKRPSFTRQRPPLAFQFVEIHDKNCRNRPFHRHKAVLRFLFRNFILSNILTYGRACLFIIPHKYSPTTCSRRHRHRRPAAPPP